MERAVRQDPFVFTTAKFKRNRTEEYACETTKLPCRR